MCEGTALPHSEQVFSRGARQRLAATRIFCLLRETRLLGTAIVLV